MSEFSKQLDKFKYEEDDKLSSDIKIIDNSIHITNNNLELSELSPEQLYAYRKFIKGENLFITGSGGTGKTHLIKYFTKFANSINKKIQVCAMTGCAAILLECNARTLHSWSGIKLAKGTKESVVSSVIHNKHSVKSWKSSNILILDEVSMLSKKVFEIIEKIARILKKDPRPFGGMQVIFTGDFFQLPPVSNNDDPESSLFCFESPIWNNLFKIENQIELKTIFRQTDDIYINILQQIRHGNLDDKNKEILNKYVKRSYDSNNTNGCIPTKLFPLRSKTDYINSIMFKKIKEEEFVFETIRNVDNSVYIDSKKPIPFDIIKKASMLSEKEITYELDLLTNSISAPQVLRLKKGAAVMCTVNLDMENSICNGSQGIIIDIKKREDKYLPVVKFSNGIEKLIELYSWQSEEFPTLSIQQVPLCLAWALTIHKIQGATLNMAEMDIGQSIFEYGQTYVALSRIKSLDGLYLSDFNSKKICANPKVIKFYKTLLKNDILEKEDNKNTITELKEEAYENNKDIKIIKL